ncbi:hypothetical protein DES53_11960 [Roseimicrobium gellanilyticum]|uniref:Uncharacterized protein n=1 Tax=Roseimicrobium gellanilyticum TaxID=748857 RepID=A0A366H3P9_9BACT|nr:hypothetical protein [Roseimicrobium gellanilyticum]RBP35894.1 hypothetical protein DES53_11960 [Roseimicrobium gellanilyticum]
MFPENLRRFIATVICALGAGTMVFGASIVCEAFDCHVEELIGDRRKLPPITTWMLESVPHDVEDLGITLLGTLGVTLGYAWLAWAYRATAFQAAFHAIVGLFATVVWASCLPFVEIMVGNEEKGPATASDFWLEHSPFIPWMILCAAPLVVAALLRWKQAQMSDVSEPL